MIPKPVLEFAITKNLKEYRDIEIILLKGHLILEQLVYQVITAYGLEEKHIERMNLSFARLIDLLIALDSDLVKKRTRRSQRTQSHPQ